MKILAHDNRTENDENEGHLILIEINVITVFNLRKTITLTVPIKKICERINLISKPDNKEYFVELEEQIYSNPLQKFLSTTRYQIDPQEYNELLNLQRTYLPPKDEFYIKRPITNPIMELEIWADILT